MGIETCYIGLLEPAANSYPPLKEEFAIPEHHRILNTMIMGYPRLEYLKTVDRKPIKTRRV
jgi:nitroreductase